MDTFEITYVDTVEHQKGSIKNKIALARLPIKKSPFT